MTRGFKTSVGASAGRKRQPIRFAQDSPQTRSHVGCRQRRSRGTHDTRQKRAWQSMSTINQACWTVQACASASSAQSRKASAKPQARHTPRHFGRGGAPGGSYSSLFPSWGLRFWPKSQGFAWPVAHPWFFPVIQSVRHPDKERS